MSHLILEHLTSNELPPEWAKQLPAGQTFSVMIVPERVTPPSNTPALDYQNSFIWDLARL